jgi:hypothetical protein
MALIRFRDSGPMLSGVVGAYEKLPCTPEVPVPDWNLGKPVKPSLLLAISMMVKSGVAALHVHLVLENFSSYETLAQPGMAAGLLPICPRACSSVG